MLEGSLWGSFVKLCSCFAADWKLATEYEYAYWCLGVPASNVFCNSSEGKDIVAGYLLALG